MTTVQEAREALAGAVTFGTGLPCSPWLLDAVVESPSCQVGRREMDPRMVLDRGVSVYQLVVRLFVARHNAIDAQRRIDEFCEPTGTSSIRVAIEDGDAWTATVDYAAVTSIGEIVEREIGAASYFTVDFDVEVVW